MKREDLIKLGVPEEAVEKIMSMHGQDIESHKTKAAAAAAEAEALKGQLTEAGKTIESFKALNVDQIKASADEWKAKAETAATEAQKQVAALKFDHALDSALAAAKAKNAKAVKALLDPAALKFNEADGSIVGLPEQLEKIKSDADYLFAEEQQPIPKLTVGGTNKTVVGDMIVHAARKAAGLAE